MGWSHWWCGRAGLLRPSAPAGAAAVFVWGAGLRGWPRYIGVMWAAAVTRMRSPSCWHWNGGPGLVAEVAQDVVGAAGELAGNRQGGPVGVDPRRDAGVVGVVRGGGAGGMVPGLEQRPAQDRRSLVGQPAGGEALVVRG